MSFLILFRRRDYCEHTGKPLMTKSGWPWETGLSLSLLFLGYCYCKLIGTAGVFKTAFVAEKL